MPLRKTPTSHGLLLDGLTIQSSARLLAASMGENPEIYPRSGRDGDGKWDFALNHAFRIGLDVSALAQLVQAVITSETIYVDAVGIARPFGPAGESALEEPSHPLSLLAPHVVRVRPTVDERIHLLKRAAIGVKLLMKDDALRGFIRLIAASKVDAAFLDITHAYFETGLSDPLVRPKAWVFTRRWTERRGKKPTPDPSDVATRLRTLLSAAVGDVEQAIQQQMSPDASSPQPFFRWLRHTLEMAILERQTRRLRRENLVFRREARRVVQTIRLARVRESEAVRQLLADLPLGTFDTPLAGADVIRHVFATLFNWGLAEAVGVAYSPHPLRSHFTGFAATMGLEERPSALRHILELLEESRMHKSVVIEKFYGSHSVEIRVPLFLAMVLRRAQSARDVIPVALELRDSREAKHFREWLGNLDADVTAGVKDLGDLQRRLSHLERVLAEWCGDESTKSEVELGFSVGFASIKKKYRVRDAALGKRSHLLLLQSLAKISDLTPQFGALIRGTFDEQTADAWDLYTRALNHFDRPSDRGLLERRSIGDDRRK